MANLLRYMIRSMQPVVGNVNIGVILNRSESFAWIPPFAELKIPSGILTFFLNSANAPEKPTSAYVQFSNVARESLKGKSFAELAKIVGEKWQNLDRHVKLVRSHSCSTLDAQFHKLNKVVTGAGGCGYSGEAQIFRSVVTLQTIRRLSRISGVPRTFRYMIP